MEDKETIIVSLTSWGPRFKNLPAVLDSVFSQTVKPDSVVLNLADDELLPVSVEAYIAGHAIEVNRMPDTKVFKKLIPTLRKHPAACVISIDDDFLLPEAMIEEFVDIHNAHPEFPISGNRVVKYGMQCHCGAASLTKAAYFGKYLDEIDSDLISECGSDDMVYTFLCNKAGHPYIRTGNRYFTNMRPVEPVDAYSASGASADKCIDETYSYLHKRFGPVGVRLSNYIADPYVRDIALDVEQRSAVSLRKQLKEKIFGKK